MYMGDLLHSRDGRGIADDAGLLRLKGYDMVPPDTRIPEPGAQNPKTGDQNPETETRKPEPIP